MSDVQIASLEELTAFFAAEMPYMRFGVPVRGKEVLEALHPIIAHKGYIAGSFAAWVSVGQEAYQPGDIDIFITSRQHLEPVVGDLENFGYRVEGWGDTVVNMEPKASGSIRYPVQLIAPHPDWKSFPLDIVKSFDMDVCRAVVLDPDTFIADIDAGGLTSTILAINSPLRVMKRVMKYHKRGVQFDDRELVKMFTAWDNMTAEQKERCITAFLPADESPSYDYNNNWDDYFFEE